MQEENISRQQSLAIIESMINKAKNQFSENGFAYLLWGWVILFCSVSQYVLQYVMHQPKHYLVWMLTWVAAIVQVIDATKRKKRKAVKTYTDEIIGYVWMTFVVMLLLCGILVGKVLEPGQFYVANIIILVLYGMPTLLSGVILKFRPLVTGGICCWILAVLASFVAPQFIILLIAAAVVAAWIIPGYLLRSRYRRENLAIQPQ
ncbi:MAG: hypothetical protein ABIU63_04765 [Chitinophagaceae bacterium]